MVRASMHSAASQCGSSPLLGRGAAAAIAAFVSLCAVTIVALPPLDAHAQGAATAVNPLTGQPLSFEATQRRLEQMRLETQMLEEEAKQTAIRNNMTLAPIRRSSEERRLQAEMFGPGALAGAAGAGGAGGALAAPTGRTTAPRRNARQPAAPLVSPPAPTITPQPVAAAPSGPQVMAILRNGEQRRAIVRMDGSTVSVVEGEQAMGRAIGPITDRTVSVDGEVIELPRTPAMIAAVDRRPPPGQLVGAPAGSPGALAASMGRPAAASPGNVGVSARPNTFAPPPVALPPLPPLPAVPVIGPVDPGNPLSALAPQPPQPLLRPPPLLGPSTGSAPVLGSGAR